MRDTAGIALIDGEHLRRQTFGDADLARELLRLFAEQCRRLLPGIVDHAGTVAKRADLAHTLKGSALGIGAERVAQLSGVIEDRLRSGEAPGREGDLARAVAETLAIVETQMVVAAWPAPSPCPEDPQDQRSRSSEWNGAAAPA